MIQRLRSSASPARRIEAHPASDDLVRATLMTSLIDQPGADGKALLGLPMTACLLQVRAELDSSADAFR